MADRTIYRVLEFRLRSGLLCTSQRRTATLGGLLLMLIVCGCESSSTIDSVMNGSDDSKGSSAAKATQGSGSGFENMAGSIKSASTSPPQTPNQPPNSEPPTPDPGGNAQKGSGLGAAGISTNLSDVSTRLDPPKVSRNDFVVRLSIPAREQLLEETKKPGKSYLLVGKVTPTTDDWRHVSFVDFYEPDRQYQFRTNGVRILVPRELVNRLHNATIDLDSVSKQYFVTLAP